MRFQEIHDMLRRDQILLEDKLMSSLVVAPVMAPWHDLYPVATSWDETKEGPRVIQTVNALLDKLPEGEAEAWIFVRGNFNRTVSDVLLNGLLASAGVALEEWDDLGCRLHLPQDEKTLGALIYLTYVSDWNMVVVNVETGQGVTLDMDQCVRFIDPKQ